MRLEILQVPGCPNVPLLEQRLDEALAGYPGPVERVDRVVEDWDTAAAVGMTGSPTLLVDGVDPFAEPGLTPSVSCRLHLGQDGRAQGAPSVAALRHALGLAGDCCAQGSGELAARAVSDWRSRARPVDPAERAVHQLILRAFATTGNPPDSSELDRAVAGFGTVAQQVLARLHVADVVRLDPTGRIQVAYPFSATPTRHRVRLASGVVVFAMCVIDALGIPPMLGTDAVITTSDPTSDAAITVTATGGRFLWDPPTAVVFRTAPTEGPSAETCCDYLNAFTNQHQAEAWIRAHPHVPGHILTPADAELHSRKIFGDLLGRASAK